MGADLGHVIRLVVLRYALLPKQLIAFDFGYTKDAKAYADSWAKDLDEKIQGALVFLKLLELDIREIAYHQKTKAILDFSETLPFLDFYQHEPIHDPFSDFLPEDVNSYFFGEHIPKYLDADEDEASIFYVGDVRPHYCWYNEISDKSLAGLLSLYAAMLDNLKTEALEHPIRSSATD